MNNLTHFYISDVLTEPLVNAQIVQGGVLFSDHEEINWDQIFSNNHSFNKWMIKAYFEISPDNLIEASDLHIINLTNEIITQILNSNLLQNNNESFKIFKLLDSLKSYYQKHINQQEVNHLVKECLVFNQAIIDKIKKFNNVIDIEKNLRLLFIEKTKIIDIDYTISLAPGSADQMLIIKNQTASIKMIKFDLYLKSENLDDCFKYLNQGNLKDNSIEGLSHGLCSLVDQWLLNL